MKQFGRKEFLKIAVLSSFSLYLEACKFKSTPVQTTKTIAAGDSVPKPPAPNKPLDFPKSEGALFYKKGDADYEIFRGGFNKRIEQYPAVIAVCKSATGIADAINYARAAGFPVAIKSGGHCFEGFSSNDGGLVIDLSQMNLLEWQDTETIAVGPGCKLGDLYDALLSVKKILPAGSCSGVGVGGLTLGGGYGLFSRKFGLTCDHLLDVVMVDGMGNIRHSKDDPDLLWACKGGGNGNFGVIAELKFKVHAAPVNLISHRFRASQLTASRAKQILEKWFQATATLPDSCFSAFVLNGKSLTILLTNFESQTKEVDDSIKVLSAFTDKTSLGKPAYLPTAIKTFYGVQEPIYFKNASAGLYNGFADIENFIEESLKIVTETPGMIYQVNTLGGAIQNKAFEDAAAYPHRSFSYLSELQTYWDKPAQAEGFLNAFKKVQEVFSKNGIIAQYRNYPDSNLQNWEEAYYGNSYKKLQAIKNKYDPENRIRSQQSVHNLNT